MGKLIRTIFGGGKKPKVSDNAVKEVDSEKRSSRRARSALIETQGGASGEELDPDSVTKRSTLLGN